MTRIKHAADLIRGFLMTFRSSLLGACALMTLATSAHAQTETNTSGETEDVIVVTGALGAFGATKSSAPILETARSVSVETSYDFISRGSLNLSDTLNYTSGVLGQAYGFATRGDFFTVRGLDVPEYRDNLQALFGNYNNTRPDLYTIDQVEVLKGPASVLYGQGSPGGIVNLASKVAGPDLGQEIVASYGTHDRAELAGDFSTTLIEDTLHARFVGVVRDSDTQVDYVNDDAIALAPSLTWTPGENTEINLLFNYDDRDGDAAGQFIPLTGTYYPGPNGETIEPSTYLGEPGFNTYETDSTALTVIGSHRLNDIFTLEGTARWRDSGSTYRQTWVAFAGAGVPRILPNGDSRYGRRWYDSEASSKQLAFDTRVRADFVTGAFEHEVLGGVNYQNVELDSESSYLLQGTINVFNPVYGDGLPTQAEIDAVRSYTSSETDYWGFYLHDQISWGNWIFNAGLRADEVSNETGAVSQDDDAVTYSVGLLYAFDNGFSPYVSYAESFEPVIGIDSFTNQALNPQEGEQVEIGVKYQPAGTRTYLTLAWFDITQTNLPNPVALPTAPSQQEGEASVTGFEFEGVTTFETGYGDLKLDAALTLLDTEDANGIPFSVIPDEQASLWAEFRPAALDALRIGAGVRYVGERESNGVSVVNGDIVRIVSDSYTLADLLIGYELEDWSVALNVRNLFDEAYYGSCLARGDCFPGEERTVNLRLAKRF